MNVGRNEVYKDKAAGPGNAAEKKLETGGDDKLRNDHGIQRRSGGGRCVRR
jgi:hypothetical protein